MSNTRSSEASLADLAGLFKAIENINEDHYNDHIDKMANTASNLSIVRQILEREPSLLLTKANGIRLTGTSKYCQDISPFEYSILQGSFDTLTPILQSLPPQAISDKLLFAFTNLEMRKITVLDSEKHDMETLDAVLTELQKIPGADDPKTLLSVTDAAKLLLLLQSKSILSEADTKKMTSEMTLKSIKKMQFEAPKSSHAKNNNSARSEQSYFSRLFGRDLFSDYYLQLCNQTINTIYKVTSQQNPDQPVVRVASLAALAAALAPNQTSETSQPSQKRM